MLTKSLLLLSCLAYLAAAHNLATYTYKTVGSLKIELDVYTPPAPAPAGGYPVFFAIHGGGFVVSRKEEGVLTETQLVEIMRRGWVLVSINYRLIPGVFIWDIMADIQDAYTWVRTKLVKRTPINPDLITVYGWSAGGGLATMCGYKITPRPKAIIGFYSGRPNWTDPSTYDPNIPVDPLVAAAAKNLSRPVITADLGENNSTRLDFYFAAKANRKMGWMVVTHDPNLPTDKIMKLLKAYSSTENVGKNFPPTYLAHGLADTVVPYNQSVQLANSLKKRGIPYVLDLIPGADHNFDERPDLWDKHVLPALDFAERHMRTKKTSKL